MSKKILLIICVIIAAVAISVLSGIVFPGNGGKSGVDRSGVSPDNGNIIVSAPVEGDIIRPGDLIVKGKARVFENQFNIRLSGGGKTIYERSAATDAKDAGIFGNFEISIPISTRELAGISNLKLEVFDYSAKDGSEIDKVSINLSASR